MAAIDERDLTAAPQSPRMPVQNVKTIDTSGRAECGYMQFNDHVATAGGATDRCHRRS